MSWKDLGGLATRWLFSVRKAVGEPESKTESQFAEEVSQAGEWPVSVNQKNGGKDGGFGTFLNDFLEMDKGS